MNYFFAPVYKATLLFPSHPLCLYILAFFHIPHLFSSLYSVFLMTGNWGIDSSAVPLHSISKATSGATRHIERSSSEIDGATANQGDDEGGGPAPLPSMKYANKVTMLAKSKTDLRFAHPSSPKHTCTPMMINEQANQSGVTGGGKSVTVTAKHCRKFSRVACTHLRRILWGALCLSSLYSKLCRVCKRKEPRGEYRRRVKSPGESKSLPPDITIQSAGRIA